MILEKVDRFPRSDLDSEGELTLTSGVCPGDEGAPSTVRRELALCRVQAAPRAGWSVLPATSLGVRAWEHRCVRTARGSEIQGQGEGESGAAVAAPCTSPEAGPLSPLYPSLVWNPGCRKSGSQGRRGRAGSS